MAIRCIIAIVWILILVSQAHAQLPGGSGNPKSLLLNADTLTYECPKIVADTSVLNIGKNSTGCTMGLQGLVTLLGNKIGDVATDFNSTTHFGGIDLAMDSGTISKGTGTSVLFNDRLRMEADNPTVAALGAAEGLYYAGGITLNGAFAALSMIHVADAVYDGAAAVTTDVGGGRFYIAFDHGTHDITGTGAASEHNGLDLQPVFRASGVNPTGGTVQAIFYKPSFSRVAAETPTGLTDAGYSCGAVVNTGVTVANKYCLRVNEATGSGTLTNYYGVKIEAITKGTTNYGIHSSMTASGTARYFLFGSGSAPSVHTGTFRIGDTTIATEKLEVAGNIKSVTAGGTFIWSGSSSGNTTVQAAAAASGTLTLPAATDTLVGKATTDTLTEKTLDCDAGSNNVCTQSVKAWFPTAKCINSAASFEMSAPASNPPAAVCQAGTNTLLATADFDAATDESLQTTLRLPSDWVGNIDVTFKWFAAATTNATGWCLQLICVADAETNDPAFPAQAAGNCVSDTAKGTTLQTNDATITNVTATGCAAGELMHMRISRDANGGAVTDNMANDASLIGIELTYRRAI